MEKHAHTAITATGTALANIQSINNSQGRHRKMNRDTRVKPIESDPDRVSLILVLSPFILAVAFKVLVMVSAIAAL